MSKIEDFAFYGASGKQYIFQVYPIGTEFKDIGGVYIFTRREINSRGGVTHNLCTLGKRIRFRSDSRGYIISGRLFCGIGEIVYLFTQN